LGNAIGRAARRPATLSAATPSQGFARAFFYTGARALLVSHWCVDNAAIVALITKYSDALKTDPKIGRAEALRRTMAAWIAGGVGPHTLTTAW
jgi:CHAT domain-containing protein